MTVVRVYPVLHTRTQLHGHEPQTIELIFKSIAENLNIDYSLIAVQPFLNNNVVTW